MKVIVDRIEGKTAVVEAGEDIYNIPAALIPGAKEGDAVEITVLSRHITDEEPHAIFEKLRRKSRKKRPSESAENAEISSPDPDGKCGDPQA